MATEKVENVEKLQTQLDEAHEFIAHMRLELEDKDRRITELTADSEILQQKLRSVQTKSSQKEKRCNALERQVEKLEKEIAEASAKVLAADERRAIDQALAEEAKNKIDPEEGVCGCGATASAVFTAHHMRCEGKGGVTCGCSLSMDAAFDDHCSRCPLSSCEPFHAVHGLFG